MKKRACSGAISLNPVSEEGRQQELASSLEFVCGNLALEHNKSQSGREDLKVHGTYAVVTWHWMLDIVYNNEALH